MAVEDYILLHVFKANNTSFKHGLNGYNYCLSVWESLLHSFGSYLKV